ncbi:MAG: sigma-70 family RNA polymerase sigma factor [Propionibacteriaceae bacterium]
MTGASSSSAGPSSGPLSACLIASAQAGDAAALESLIGYVRVHLFRYCWGRLARYTGGPDMVDDVTQEACLAVCTVLPRFVLPPDDKDAVSLFHGWMYTIAKAKVADGQRRMMRAPEPIDELPEAPDLGPTPEEEAMSTAGVTAISGILASLPERTRQVLMLRAHGYSAEAAGKQLGMSAAAVRTAHHRGLARLRVLADTTPDLLAGYAMSS